MRLLLKISVLYLLFFTEIVSTGQGFIPSTDSLAPDMSPIPQLQEYINLSPDAGYIKKDTLPEHIQLINADKKRNSNLLDTIKNRNFKYKWMRELTNIIVLNPDTLKEKEKLSTRRSLADFVEFNGYIIRSVNFIKLNVYGGSLYDTVSIQGDWLTRTANSLHVKTSDKVLERQLLFNTGDTIDSRILADNERLIRELPFIQDVRIRVNPVDDTSHYADVDVIVRDRGSKAFYVDVSALDAGKVELWDRNIFGSGNEFQNNIHWDGSKSGTWGYEAFFLNRNIYGSFIDGSAEYRNVFEYQSFGIQFNRKFFTPNTKYAGGASAYRINTVRTLSFNPFAGIKIPIGSDKYDFWLGRAFRLNKYAAIDKNRVNLILAARYYQENFFERPDITPRSFYEYQNKIVWLNSLALSSQSFYRTSLIYNYGRREDIPIGYLASITAGPEFGEFQDRIYTGVNIAAGYYLLNFGYLYVSFIRGGFYSWHLGFDQGLYQFDADYFTNLFIIRRFKLRQFASLHYIKGVRRYDYEYLNLDDNIGIRGFPQTEIFGTQKVVLNLETALFTPFYLMGFRFVGFGFADLGKIVDENANILNGKLHSGIGFGIRVHNERLVFPTFELRFAYYPETSPIAFDEMIRFLGEKRLNPPNFYFKYPSIADFK